MYVRPPQAAGHEKKGASVIRHIFIINPAAGKPETTHRLEEQLSRLSVPHEVFYTREAGDAQRITEQTAQDGEPARIYACGGDGTLNEVVNGAAGRDFLAVTNVPKGTGNDFLKLFGPRYRELFSDLEAMPDDGVLDILLVGEVSLATFLRLVRQYARGHYRRYPQWVTAYHGQAVRFSAQEPITVVVDGEIMRDTRFTVRLSEKKVNFFYPSRASYQPGPCQN